MQIYCTNCNQLIDVRIRETRFYNRHYNADEDGEINWDNYHTTDEDSDALDIVCPECYDTIPFWEIDGDHVMYLDFDGIYWDINTIMDHPLFENYQTDEELINSWERFLAGTQSAEVLPAEVIRRAQKLPAASVTHGDLN